MRTQSLWRTLDWDSHFFGIQIASVIPEKLEYNEMQTVIAECIQKKIKCLYFLCDPAHGPSVLLAENNGFMLVDHRVLLRNIGMLPRSFEVKSPLLIRPAIPEDLPILKRMAGDIFRSSRVFFDPHFPAGRAASLYETWIEKSFFEKNPVFVAGDKIPAGFVTCSSGIAENTGKIDLMGVAPDARGRGIGRALLNTVLTYFFDLELKAVEVVTQDRNAAAKRLYQSAGFITAEKKIWFHKWFMENYDAKHND